MNFIEVLFFTFLAIIFAILCIILAPFVLAFLLIAFVCFLIALPSIIVFGLIYLVYKYGVKNKESKIPLVLFIIALILLSPLLLILLILCLPLAFVVLIVIYGDGNTVGSRRSSSFNTGFTMAMGTSTIASAF